MNRHTLVGCLGKLDRGAAKPPSGEKVTRLLLGTVDGRLEFGLARVLRDLNKLGVSVTETGIDLLLLATLVQCADTRIARATESQDAWTREIHLVVPVSDPSRWGASRSVLETMLSFLSGDLWTVGFSQRPPTFKVAVGGKQAPKAPSFDQVSLFSGGLDSLVGAVDALEAGATPLFVSHAAEGSTSTAQNACFQGLKANYQDRPFARLRAWFSARRAKFAGQNLPATLRRPPTQSPTH